MNFRERKITYEQLKGEVHLEADKALLAKLNPGHNLLTRLLKPDRLQAEILWELLGMDAVTREMVVKNRRSMQGPSVEEMKAIVEEAGKLTAHIHKVESFEAKQEIINLITEMIKMFPVKLQEPILSLANGIVPDFVKKAEAEKELLAMDLDKATQKEMAAMVRALKLETKDMKADTIRPVLAAVQTQCIASRQSHSDQVIDQMNANAGPKTDEGNGEENTGVDANPDGSVSELVEEEKEELLEKVEELEYEKEELEEENEDLKEQLEAADAEKKSTSKP